jgi:hypothetical protein
MRTRLVKRTVWAAAIAIIVGGTAAGCGLIEELESLLGFNFLGVNPASNFIETGELELAWMQVDEDGRVHDGRVEEDDVDVVIEHDGDETECDLVDDGFRDASEFNSIALVLDGSGSMERAYPVEEYGDLCPTCPHDPERVRVSAAADLIDLVNAAAPETELAVMEFGPEPSAGWAATQMLADFTTDPDALISALDQVTGADEAGTPLWDSLAEIIAATGDSAEALAQYQRTIIIQGNNNDVDCADYDDDDDIIIQGNNNDVYNCGSGDSGDGSGSGDGGGVDDGGGSGVDDGGGSGVDDGGGSGVDDTPGDDIDVDVRAYILVISDGDDRDSVDFSLDDVIALANERDVVVHAIGLGPASASFESPLLRTEEQVSAVTALERLAAETGGFYASVNDPQGLRELYRNIAQSLTQGYSATRYDCSDAIDGDDAPRPGERMDGYVESGGNRHRFSFIVP